MRCLDLADADLLRAVDEPDAVRKLTEGLSVLDRAGYPMLVACPSTWGRPRRQRLESAVCTAFGPVALRPRALLIAASHADALIRTCAVVEELLIPGESAGEGPVAWSVHVLRRADDRWRLIDSNAGESPPDGGLPAPLKDLLGIADVVFVDGPRSLIESVMRGLPSVRSVEVDRALLRRHGSRALRPRDDFDFIAAPQSGGRRLPRILVGLAAAVILALGVAGLLARWPRPAAAVTAEPQRVGPVTLTVPADWQRTELSGEAADDGRGLRAVFADGGDGRRLIVVVTALRTGATKSSVARSLANRIAQRGDDVVVEFAPDTRYGGRPVISYREAPASGPAVRWYIIVDGSTQVSVGCQAGTGSAPIEGQCRVAVGSVAVTALSR